MINSDDELPLNKMIEITTITIVVRAVFHENNKYFLSKFSYMNVCIKDKNEK